MTPNVINDVVILNDVTREAYDMWAVRDHMWAMKNKIQQEAI